MEGNNFEKVNSNKENAEVIEIKFALDNEVQKENPENWVRVIKWIAEAFTKGLQAEDKEAIKEAYSQIKTHDNYLSAKYRSTDEQQVYLRHVQAAMDYLSDRLLSGPTRQ
ncbi:MAG TPA: hypothetical protein VLB02_02965 [Candidatus Paceibacterota bacterium]|nr:hypothetical protein [Candidatus Paceibacterota bacterium]